MEKPAPILDASHADRFVEYFRILQRTIHGVNVKNGWFDSPDATWLKDMAESYGDDKMNQQDRLRLVEIAGKLESRNDGEMIALMHSELSEALEGHRHKNPASDHIPQFTALEEEMADTIIRIMDYAEYRKLDVAQAIIVKLKFNAGRGHRHGGKVC